MKLTRKAIAEGLSSVPIDTILLGVANAKTSRLTHKQRAFAREVAMGESKAGAYRKAYDSTGKGTTESQEGQKLVKNPMISRQIEAFKLAIEAQKYSSPIALRSLVIERLTATAIDDNIKPAQRLRALELLGKVTEVAAFTERREIIKTDSSDTARDKLVQSLRMAIATQAGTGGASLLAELARRNGSIDADITTAPTLPTTYDMSHDRIDVAHNQSLADTKAERQAEADAESKHQATAEAESQRLAPADAEAQHRNPTPRPPPAQADNHPTLGLHSNPLNKPQL
jgi:hypothetical protein